MADKEKKSTRILPWIYVIIALAIVGLRIISKNDENVSFYEDDSSASEYVETQEPDEVSKNDELLWQLAQNEEQIQAWGNELATIEQLPQVSSSHIVRVAFLKQNILKYIDEGIDISRQIGDDELIQEYIRRKQTLMLAFQNMRF